MQYFEDVIIGEVRRLGSHTLTREETTDFAAKYDPQDFHLSDEAAAKSFFGRVSASGWNTAAVMMKLLVNGTAGDPDASVQVENLAKRRSRSKPGQGTIWQKMTLFNQDEQAVLTATLIGLIKLRDPAGDPADGGTPPA